MNISETFHKDQKLSIRESAEMLCKSEDYVRRLIRAGRLPVVKYGPRSQFVLREDLDKFIFNSYSK